MRFPGFLHLEAGAHLHSGVCIITDSQLFDRSRMMLCAIAFNPPIAMAR